MIQHLNMLTDPQDRERRRCRLLANLIGTYSVSLHGPNFFFFSEVRLEGAGAVVFRDENNNENGWAATHLWLGRHPYQACQHQANLQGTRLSSACHAFLQV